MKNCRTIIAVNVENLIEYITHCGDTRNTSVEKNPSFFVLLLVATAVLSINLI